MKPYVKGKNIYFREITVSDAEFVFNLRNDPVKNQYLSKTSNILSDQIAYLENYAKKTNEYYFIISNYENEALGAIRIYDLQEYSFCWGSWIIGNHAPRSTAIESALLIYEFGFYALHFQESHFDVRLDNQKVVEFHQRFGAEIISSDQQNHYFIFKFETYLKTREKYQKFLP